MTSLMDHLQDGGRVRAEVRPGHWGENIGLLCLDVCMFVCILIVCVFSNVDLFFCAWEIYVLNVIIYHRPRTCKINGF